MVEFLFRNIDASSIKLAELKAAAANSDETLKCLLHRLPVKSEGDSSTQTRLPEQELATLIVRNCRRTRTLMEAADRIPRSQPLEADELGELVRCAARNPHGIYMASYILEQFRMFHKTGKLKVTSEMLCAAASNPRAAPEMLRLLLNSCKDRDVQRLITSEVLCVAAKNGHEAPAALRVLLDELKYVDTLIQFMVSSAVGSNTVARKKTAKVFEEFLRRQEYPPPSSSSSSISSLKFPSVSPPTPTVQRPVRFAPPSPSLLVLSDVSSANALEPL
jgi:hypothetical protein